MSRTGDDGYYNSIRDRVAHTYAWEPRPETPSAPATAQGPAQPDATAESFNWSVLRRTIADMRKYGGSVGEAPPEPPTLRGRIGALLIRLVRRALFWYTPRILQFHDSAVCAQEQQSRLLEAVALTVTNVQSQVHTQAQALNERLNQMEEAVAAEANRNRELFEHLESLEASFTEGLEHMRAEIASAGNSSRLEHRIDLLEGGLARVASLECEINGMRAQARAEKIEKDSEREAAARRHAAWRQRLDDFYVRLEDEFRGSHEAITSRLDIYIPVVEKAIAGKDHATILDIGSGRGEWLELLRDHNWEAMGIEQNQLMVHLCETKGLRVRGGDAIDYLKSLPGGCLDVVTAFHVIEHLPIKSLFELWSESFRVLSPTGIAIFETPNPKNLYMSARYFYLDPTHRHPIPSELARLLAELHGFEEVDILELHPWPDSHYVNSSECSDLAGRFNELFYGPQDYGIVAWKRRRAAICAS